MTKDWTGNSKSTFTTLGASSHSDKIRDTNDYYATDPNALQMFLDKVKNDGGVLNKNIWECSCGEGHLSKVLEKNGYEVKSTDLIDRGYGQGGINFLTLNEPWDGDILTNPPYKYAQEFVEKAISLINIGNKVIMFLRIQFLEGKERYKLFQTNPPKYVYVHSSRQICAMNGDFVKYDGSATCFCWFVWEKGFIGDTVIRWLIEEEKSNEQNKLF